MFINYYFYKNTFVPYFFWLPEAHVEITWIGSVILATIILKYSLLFVQLFCSSLDFCVCILINIILFICTIAVILMLMFIVVDIKIFGAYLSIFHMNGGLVATIFSSCEALINVDFVWVSHSVSALWYFLLCGIFYSYLGARVMQTIFTAYILPLFLMLTVTLLIINIGVPLGLFFIVEVFIVSSVLFILSSCIIWILFFVLYLFVVVHILFKFLLIFDVRRSVNDVYMQALYFYIFILFFMWVEVCL